jgi:hypothetical protein
MSEEPPKDPRLQRLYQRREQAAERLHGQEKFLEGDRRTPNLRHQALEKQYNEINKQIHIAEGNSPRSYKYQHDNRHEKWTSTETRQAKRGTETVEKTVHIERPADSVIQWRDHRVGRLADAKARAESRAQGNYRPGDAVGHDFSMKSGAAPADRSSHFPQNAKTNIKNWNDLDLEKQNHLKQTSTRYLVVETNKHTVDHRYTGERPYKVTQNIKDPHGNRPLGDKRIFANPVDHSPGGPVPVPPKPSARSPGPPTDPPGPNVVPLRPPGGPKSPPGGPKTPPGGPKSPPAGPAGPGDGPKGPSGGPKSPPGGPKSPPAGPAGPGDGPKGPPGGPKTPPGGPKSPPGGPKSPPAGPQSPPGGPKSPPGGPKGMADGPSGSAGGPKGPAAGGPSGPAGGPSGSPGPARGR